jgi:autotransporter passenger strand-loop-strand repeat protein
MLSSVMSGQIVSGIVVGTGDILTVVAGGSAVALSVGGQEIVLQGGSDSGAAVLNGGQQLVEGQSAVTVSGFVSAGGTLDVNGGGTASGTTVYGSASVASGGTAFRVGVGTSGTLTVSGSAAYASAITISRGFGAVDGGGSIDAAMVGAGAELLVDTGGTGFGTRVGAGGTQEVVGGVATSSYIGIGGSDLLEGDGLESAATIAGGVQTLDFLGVGLDETVEAGGTIVVASLGIASGANVYFSGLVSVQAGGSAVAPTIDGGGLMLASGATVEGGIVFAASRGTLDIAGTTLPGTVISGFAAGDSIDLTDIAPGNAPVATYDSAHRVLTIDAGGIVTALDLAGDYTSTGFSLTGDGASGSLVTVACFAAGTRIATTGGEVPVERLSVGDSVRSPWGEAMPIRWLGHRHVDCVRHPRRRDVWPVRVRAGAFGPGRPARDLLLSPDHALFLAPPGLRPVLVPVCCLIDGDSIVQERVACVAYWHIELDRHAVLLAEGLPCESFLDTGNRAAFAGGGAEIQLHPDFGAVEWEAIACAPQVRGGPVLDWARACVAAHRGYHRAYPGETGTATSLRRSGGSVQGGS